MAHVIYDNFYLSNEVQDAYASHLDLSRFVTADNNLVGEPGMTRKVNVYSATGNTEKLAMGEGNTSDITVNVTQKEYKILLAQNKFAYYDEQEMTDPMLVPVGMQKAGASLFDTANADVYAEWLKGTQKLTGVAAGFDMFADAVALMNIEGTDNDPAQVAPLAFAIVNPKDMAKIRKVLKDDLKYVEAFVSAGYVGTVGGVNIYTKKNATEGTIVIATAKAVTLFNKKGVEVEQKRDGNIRLNEIFSRKYYFAALTDDTKVVVATLA